jgi:hypothetical protein
MAGTASVGMTAAEVIVDVLGATAGIEAFRLSSYLPAPDLESRLASDAQDNEAHILDRGRRLAAREGMPLWAAIVNSYLDDRQLTTRLLREALVHDRTNERDFILHDAKLSVATIDGIAKTLDPGFVLALDSRVDQGHGRHAHIPMIDFRCSPSPRSLEAVREALQAVGEARGVLLASGRSYHYYGLRLATDDEWRVFLARCLLLAPLVDVRYVAHRLIDGFSRLRITAAVRKPVVPRVVAVL